MTTDRRILLAGATGAIGRRLVAALVANGDNVFGLARSRESGDRIRALGATPVAGAALESKQVFAAVAEVRPEIIVHQATAIPRSAVNPRRMAEAFATTNRLRREGARNLVDAAQRYDVERLVAQSIAFGYRADGPSALDESSPLDNDARGGWGEFVSAVAALEDAVMSSEGVNGVVLRYGTLYGPDTAFAPDGFMTALARARRLPIVGDGGGLQSFLHIDDAVVAALAAVEAGVGIYNVVDDEPVRARDWIPAFAEAIGAPAPRVVPVWLARAVAGDDVVRTMTIQRGASNAKIRLELNWRPRYADWRSGFRTLAGTDDVPRGAASHG